MCVCACVRACVCVFASLPGLGLLYSPWTIGVDIGRCGVSARQYVKAMTSALAPTSSTDDVNLQVFICFVLFLLAGNQLSPQTSWHREVETDRQTDTHTHTHADRQTDRHSLTQACVLRAVASLVMMVGWCVCARHWPHLPASCEGAKHKQGARTQCSHGAVLG